MTLSLTPDAEAHIRNHGAATYPEECCGVLLGTVEGAALRVRQTFEVPNTREANRERRYLIGPKDFLAAERQARALGLDVVGFYHSHPDHPAQPSQTDLEEATFPGYAYLIVSVHQGEPVDLTAWTLADDRSTFTSLSFS